MLTSEPRFAGSAVSPGENLDPEPDRDRTVASRAIACPPRTNSPSASRSARSRSARRCASWPSSDTSAASRAAGRSCSGRRSSRGRVNSPVSARRCAARASRPGPRSSSRAPCRPRPTSPRRSASPRTSRSSACAASASPMATRWACRRPTSRPDFVPRIEDVEFSRSSLYDVLGGHYDLVPAQRPRDALRLRRRRATTRRCCASTKARR